MIPGQCNPVLRRHFQSSRPVHVYRRHSHLCSGGDGRTRRDEVSSTVSAYMYVKSLTPHYRRIQGTSCKLSFTHVAFRRTHSRLSSGIPLKMNGPSICMFFFCSEMDLPENIFSPSLLFPSRGGQARVTLFASSGNARTFDFQVRTAIPSKVSPIYWSSL